MIANEYFLTDLTSDYDFRFASTSGFKLPFEVYANSNYCVDCEKCYRISSVTETIVVALKKISFLKKLLMYIMKTMDTLMNFICRQQNYHKSQHLVARYLVHPLPMV